MKTKILLSVVFALGMMTNASAQSTTYDLTDTEVWGTQVIADGIEHVYGADGKEASSGITFCFEEGAATWQTTGDITGVKFNGAPTEGGKNYAMVVVPAGWAADIMAKGGNEGTRRLAAGWDLASKTEELKFPLSTTEPKTLKNETDAARELFVFQPNAANGILMSIKVYDPTVFVKHAYTANLCDEDGNPLAEAITGEAMEQNEFTFTLPKTLIDEEYYYCVLEGSEGRSDFAETKTMGTEEATFNYTYVRDESILIYKELSQTLNIHASGGSYMHSTDKVFSETLEAGTYEMEMNIFAYGNGRRVEQILVNDIEVAKIGTTDEDEYEANPQLGVQKVTLTLTADENTVVVQPEGGNTNNIDYILIRSVDPMGISEIKDTRIAGNENVYDLQGRRVTNPQKGIYIRNGKKVCY